MGTGKPFGLLAIGAYWALGFRALGFRGLGFRGLGIRGLGFRGLDVLDVIVIKGRHWRRLGSKNLNSKVIPRWNGGESEVTKKGNSKVNQR